MSLTQFANLIEILDSLAQTKPNHLAIRNLADGENETESCTYAELREAAQKIAAYLQEQAEPGSRVLLLHRNGFELLRAFFACQYAGMIAVPAFPPAGNKSDERLQSIISDSEASILLTEQATIDALHGKLAGKKGLEYATDLLKKLVGSDQLVKQGLSFSPTHINESDIAFLQYTSGSLGVPKGVMVTHRNLVKNLDMLRQGFEVTQDSVVVSWLPLFHDMGLLCSLEPLALGGTIVLMPHNAFIQKPKRWWDAVSKYRAAITGGPNFAYELSLKKLSDQDFEGFDLSSLKVLFNGAEPIQQKTLLNLVDRLAKSGVSKTCIVPCYGLAEATVMVTSCPPDREYRVRKHTVSDQRSIDIVGCGSTKFQEEILIVDPQTRKKLRDGEEGEVWVRGDNITLGYWNRSALNQETFNARLCEDDPTSRNAKRYLRTGDLGLIADEELFITGRIKDLIIVNGGNHYPHDIEQSIHSAIEQIKAGNIAAFSLRGELGESVGIVAEIDFQLDDSGSKALCDRIFAAVYSKHFIQPTRIDLIKIGHLKRTTSGKIRRQATKTAALNNELPTLFSWLGK